MTVEIDLSGKVAIVTSVGRGIGKAIALRLAEAGADVCVTARTVAEIEATAQGVRQIGRAAVAVRGDATDAIAVADVIGKTITALHRLHILVNNAGMELPKPLHDTTEADYNRVMDTNVKSMVLFTQA